MAKQLMLLEVSQKQAYIFGSRALRDNQQRSDQIAKVTGSAYFEEECPEGYDREKNMIYSGGGHTVLQFDSEEEAVYFSRKITESVLRRYPEMELFVKIMAFDEADDPGESLNRLSRRMEEKKSRRTSSFRLFSLGIEKETAAVAAAQAREAAEKFEGWNLSYSTEEIAGDDNFLAVIHIDGNSMGKRVQGIYETCRGDWSECARKLKAFSRCIDADFSAAYDEMAKDLIHALEKPENAQWVRKKLLPLRKIIGAGDDVCFVTTGYFGLECAARFLEHLTGKINQADGLPYTACAGVVLIHKKFPFRRAYDLSEELCSNAKAFAAQYGGNISALDYHIEFGQMKDSLSKIRADYRSEDGGYLELRPLAVTGSGVSEVPRERHYEFLTAVLKEIKKNSYGLARGKLKSLRAAFRQGEVESRLALRKTRTENLLNYGMEMLSPGRSQTDGAGERAERSAFFTDGEGKRRCLYYDAIEIADNTQIWRETTS